MILCVIIELNVFEERVEALMEDRRV